MYIAALGHALLLLRGALPNREQARHGPELFACTQGGCVTAVSEPALGVHHELPLLTPAPRRQGEVPRFVVSVEHHVEAVVENAPAAIVRSCAVTAPTSIAIFRADDPDGAIKKVLGVGARSCVHDLAFARQTSRIECRAAFVSSATRFRSETGDVGRTDRKARHRDRGERPAVVPGRIDLSDRRIGDRLAAC